MGTNCEEVRSFKTSRCYDLARDQLRSFYLRGQDDYFEYLREAGVFSRIIEAQSAVQIINILGYMLRKPMSADLERLPTDQLERLLQTGNHCFIEDNARKELEKVVEQMKSYRFELIPLIAVTDQDDAGKNGETLLIKVYESSGTCSYVDIRARHYYSFGNFLDDNELPPSILCYPEYGVLRFDANNRVVTDCCKVGTLTAILSGLDVVAGVAGTIAGIGAIFATGGLAAIPLVAVAGASSVYGVGRQAGKLIDASMHGKSVNPFTDAEACKNWALMSLNAVSFASLGTTALVTRANGFTTAEKIVGHTLLKGSSAYASAITAAESVSAANDRQLNYERITMASMVCVAFREIISFSNYERLLQRIRTMNIDRLYKFFKDRLDSVVTVGQNFLTCVTKMFDNNDGFLAAAMKLMATIAQKPIDVTVSKDFVTIRFFGLEYRMVNILSMAIENVSNFVYMILGIAENLRDGFALLRMICKDRLIESVVFKRALELGGNWGAFGKAINQLIEVFMVIRAICDDFSILADCQITFKGGHRFTLASAYRTFVNKKGTSLLRALVEMNPREGDRMNSLRLQWSSKDRAPVSFFLTLFRPKKERLSKEGELFAFITHSSTGSSEMLVKIRFVLAVFEICTRKSLRITDVHPEEQTVEIDKLIRIGSEQFYRSAYPDFLIDAKFLRICEPAWETHREFLETLWKNACISPEMRDRAFEKATTLETTFKSCLPAAIKNAISYASTMPCSDLSLFTCHVLFALKDTRNLTHAELQSSFQDFTRKAGDYSLDGYCPMSDRSLAVDPSQLIGTIKDFATNGRLRFGTIENGALHMKIDPRMFRAGMGIATVNGWIANEIFDREEVDSPYDGKRMVLLEKEDMLIVVGVVRGLGAYIDSYK